MKAKRRPKREPLPPLVRDAAVCVALAALVVAVFFPAVRYGFLLYDDGRVVYENPNISTGLTWTNIVWAFTHAHFAIWMPVTSLSHMLDASLYGSWAGGHHASSIALHALAAILLYLAMSALTGRWGLSALCAAVFAVHPQRVEAVAWVSSRKEILCGLFFFAAMWAYARYAQRPGARRMAAVCVLCALALMSKPMAVTLPFALLLLDVWPLNRVTGRQGARGIAGLVAEKLPLFALAAVVAVIAVSTQPDVSEITAVGSPPFAWRAGNAVISYVAYLAGTLFPWRLAAHYPVVMDAVTLSRVLVSCGILAGITVAAIIFRGCRWLIVGWLWFLGILIPVMGLVQYGNAARADRYLYVPQIGLLIALIWTAASMVEKWPRPVSVWGVRLRAQGPAVLGTLLLAGTALACRWQLGYWRDTETLFTRTVAVQPASALGYANLGMAALMDGDKEHALACYRKSVQLEPENAVWLYNLGSMLVLIRQYGEAANLLERSLDRNPENPGAQENLGVALSELGRATAARPHFEEAIRLRPEKAGTYVSYADTLLELGRREEAIAALEQALRREPSRREWQTRIDRLRQAAP